MHKHLSNGLLILAFVLAALQRAGAIQLPPFAPWALFACIALASVWYYSRLGAAAQYQEYLYEPFDSYDLSPETRDFFNKHTPAFARLGLEKLADSRLSESPHRHDVRLFQSADGTVLGEISSAGTILCAACSSLFEDGMLIETNSLEKSFSTLPQSRDRMQWVFVPNGTVEEIYDRHSQAIEHYQLETGAEVLAFAPEDYQDIITYQHRLLWHWRKRRGLTSEPVPDATLPTPAQPFAVS